MCFSFQTSILSYSLGMIASLAAIATRQYVLGVLILFYCQIQLSEALIWRGIDTKNPDLNVMGTRYGKYMLPTHNIAIGLGILLAYMILQRKPKDPLITWRVVAPLIIGILFYGIVLLIYSQTPSDSMTFPLRPCEQRSCQNPSNRLKWPFWIFWYIFSFIISIILMLVYIPERSSGVFLGGTFTLIYLSSYVFFRQSLSSLFCFLSAVMAPFLVIVNYLLLRYYRNL